jgi:hypothetical protein
MQREPIANDRQGVGGDRFQQAPRFADWLVGNRGTEYVLLVLRPANIRPIFTCTGTFQLAGHESTAEYLVPLPYDSQTKDIALAGRWGPRRPPR